MTSHQQWSTDQIVRASLDRYMVEQAFRQSKADGQVKVSPIRHWTDSKIRCHIFTCIAALAYLRLIELRLEQHGLQISGRTAMEQMHRLHSCLCWMGGYEKPNRIIEGPSELQAQILSAFGHQMGSGVLQKFAA